MGTKSGLETLLEKSKQQKRAALDKQAQEKIAMIVKSASERLANSRSYDSSLCTDGLLTSSSFSWHRSHNNRKSDSSASTFQRAKITK